MKKCFAIILAVLTALLVPMTAMANEDLYTDQTIVIPDHNQGSHRYIFVRTGSGWFAVNSVDLDIQMGTMSVDLIYKDPPSHSESPQCYPAMEVRVWRWVPSEQQWVKDRENFDIYSDDSESIEFDEDNTTYCVHLYFWRPITVAQSYQKNKEFYFGNKWIKDDLGSEFTVTGAEWLTNRMPIVTVTPGRDTLMFKQNPLPILPHEE